MTSAAGITCVSVSNTLKPFFILCLLCVFQRGSPSSRSCSDYSAEPDAHASLPQRAPREAIDADRSSRVETKPEWQARRFRCGIYPNALDFESDGRLRRISPVAAHSCDRLLFEPTADTPPCRGEP